MASSDPPREPRKHVGLLIRLQHQNVDAFVESFATNISSGGMFVRTKEPHAVGTPVRFEVQIAGGMAVLRGTATVRWTRRVDDPEGPPGMGLQFDQLDAKSKDLIGRMLETKPAVSLATPPARAAAPAPVAAAAAPKAKPAAPRPPPAPAAAQLAQASSLEEAAEAAAAQAARTEAARQQKAAAAKAAVAPPAARAAVKGAAPRPAVAPPPPPPSGPPRSAHPPPAAPRAAAPAGAPPLPPKTLEEALGDEPLTLPPTPDDHVDLGFDVLGDDNPPAAKPVAAAAPPAPKGGTGNFVEFDSPDEAGPSLELAFAPRSNTPPAAASPKPAPPRAAPPARAAAVPPPPPAAAVAPPSPAPSPAASVLPPVKTPFARVHLEKRPSNPELRAVAAPAPAPNKDLPPALPPVGKAAPPVVPMVKGPEAPSAEAPAAAADSGKKTVFLPDPRPTPKDSPVIGIDLGTTNSCVAIFQVGRSQVLRSKDGYNTIPSILSLTAQGKLLIGHRAKDQLMLNPTDTIYGAKRLVGRAYESATVREVRERFHYAIVPDSAGKAAVRLGGKVVTLEEVQGLVLKECKEMAEAYLGKEVGRAVVTVPAYYAEHQREAVRRAGQLAGLKVERILNEPTAAALAYGLNRQLSRKVLVYDLGGGTFDATVLRVQNNVFEVLATGGDTFLGGVDFDNSIVDLLIEKFQTTEDIHFSGDSVALSRIHDAAERAKVALSERSSFDVSVPMLMMDDKGKAHSLNYTLTRKDIEAACGHLVDRTMDVVRDVLLDAKLKSSQLDDVILVGGQSRMPMAREKLQQLLGKAPHAGVNADEAVALGAALLASTIDKVSSVVLIDVLPVTIGVGLPGGKFQSVLQRNVSLPAKATLPLVNTEANQRELEVFLFQGEDAHIAANEYLGTARIFGMPPGKKGAVKVNLTLRLDPECHLSIDAKDESGKDLKTSLHMDYTAEQLQKKLQVSKESANQAVQARAEDLRSRGGKFWSFLRRAVGRADA